MLYWVILVYNNIACFYFIFILVKANKKANEWPLNLSKLWPIMRKNPSILCWAEINNGLYFIACIVIVYPKSKYCIHGIWHESVGWLSWYGARGHRLVLPRAVSPLPVPFCPNSLRYPTNHSASDGCSHVSKNLPYKLFRLFSLIWYYVHG